MKHCQRHTGLKKAMNKVTLTFDQIANCEKLLLSCQHPLNGKNLLSSFWQVPLCASQKKLEECSPFLSYCCGFTQPLHRSDRNWKIHTFHHWQIAHTHSTATLLLLATTSLSYQILISNQHTRHHRIYCLSFFIFSLLFCRLIIHLLIFEYFWTIWSFVAIKAMKRGFVIYYEFVDHCCLTLENHTCVVTCDDQHYCAYCINMARTPPGPEEKGVLVLFRSNKELNVFL